MKKILQTLAIGVLGSLVINLPSSAGMSPPANSSVSTGVFYNTVLQDTTYPNKQLNINSNFSMSADTSSIAGYNIDIKGNGHSIDGSQYKGMVIGEDNSLLINNLTLKNFKDTAQIMIPDAHMGGAIFNQGYLVVRDSAFSNNLNTIYIDDENTFGGAIINYLSDAKIYNSSFSNNISEGAGGAIFSGGSSLDIKDSTFTSNQAMQQGGAIYSIGGSLVVDNSTFTSNSATEVGSSYAGAIYVANDSQISDSSFVKNSADQKGGAIYVDQENTPAVDVLNSTFGSNSVSDANTAELGGAIYAENDTALSIKNSTFKNNSASSMGGAIFSESDDLRISNSIFDANNADEGGAIFSQNETKIYDSNFTNNTGSAICNSDGNLYVVANNRKVLFDNNTNSSSGNGGAINSSGNTYLVANTSGITFSNNSATEGNDIYNEGILYLNSGVGDITFSGGVTSPGSINVNSPYTLDLFNTETAGDNAPTTGRVILNSALSGNGNLTLNGGMFQVGTSGSIGSPGNSIGDLTLSGTSILNLANRQGITVEADNFIINDTPSIWLDANLSDNSSSVINSAWTVSGTPKFLFRIFADSYASSENIIITTDTTQNMTGFSSIGYTNGYKYDFSGAAAGSFDYTQTASADGLKAALADTGNRSFSLVGDDYVSTSSKNIVSTPLASGTLTVFGTGKNGLAISGGDDTVDGDNYHLFSVNSGAILNIVDAVIKNSYTSFDPGAIYSEGTLNIYDSLLSNNINTIAEGGAIYNKGNAYVNGTTFSYNKSSDDITPYGGAIFTKNGTFTVYNSDFDHNDAAAGGAITNFYGTLIVSNSRFTDNSATLNTTNSRGGAICNANSGTAKIYGSTFTSNIATVSGGAINNSEGGLLTVYNSNFITNSAGVGGAIVNYVKYTAGTTASIYNSLFDQNEATTGNGGAINNNGSNKGTAALTIVDSTFTGNKANASNACGGAIFNEVGTLTVSNSTFKGNTATTNSGGAIATATGSRVSIEDSTFGGDLLADGNKALYGGALHSAGTSMKVNSSVFKNNSATNYGGAIYNAGGTLNIIASNDNTIFLGNTAGASSTPNDIYLEVGSTLNLNSSHGNIIYIGGGIKTTDSGNAININPTGILQYDGVTNAPTVGEVILNGAISGATAAVNTKVNLYNGILTLNNDSNLNGSDLSLNGGLLNLVNNNAGVMNLNSIEVKNNTSIAIDADLANAVSDKITATTASTITDKKLIVSSINLLSDAKTESTKTQLIDSSIADNVSVRLDATKAYTPIYQYDITYDGAGNLNFAGGPSGGGNSNFNPAVVATPVAAQSGAFVNQVNSYSQAFQNMDYTMLMPRAQRMAIKNANKYALLEGGADKTKLQGLVYEEKYAGAWFQPYASIEKVNFSNGPKVNNTSYGSLFGGDSKYIELKRGWEAVYSGYAGYNGSTQSYAGNRIYQNGGQLGAGATFYKGNSFTGLTLNVGASTGEASTMYGRDNFNMLSSGLAAKTGYNFEFNEGKFIVQPSYMMSYTFVNTFDYTNAAGVKISSDPINAIQIAPGVKFIANTKSGWQPYFGVEMLWNIMDKAKYYANDVSLPEISVKPYVQYGIGVQKRIGDRLTGFAQSMVRNGGRTGVSLSFGFRYALGKDSTKL